MRTLTLFCAALAVLPVACSSRQQVPARNAGVAAYGPTSQSPAPAYTPPAPAAPAYTRAQPAAPPAYVRAPATPPAYARAPATPPTPAARPPASTAPVAPTYPPPAGASTYTSAPGPSAPAYAAGPLVWNTRITDAQAQARRENKLILVGSTKPGCGLCEKFRTQTVPGLGSRVSSYCVGYMCQAPTGTTSPEAPYIWQQLRANLPNAGLMPLVGIFTPDLRYLTGFGGPGDSQQLLNAIATARRLYPVSAPAPVRAGSTGGQAVTVRNEYGEYEWTPLEEVYPAPVDALTPDAVVAAKEVLPPAPPAPATPVAKPAAAAPSVAAVLPAVTQQSKPAVAPYGKPAVAPHVMPAVAPHVMPAVAPHVKPAVAPPPKPPFHKDPEPVLETWGAQALREALARIQAGDLDAAKARLAEVHARLPGTPLAREAAKGGVAVYNLGRIQAAQGSERERLRAEAERNLGSSMWGVLFQPKS